VGVLLLTLLTTRAGRGRCACGLDRDPGMWFVEQVKNPGVDCFCKAIDEHTNGWAGWQWVGVLCVLCVGHLTVSGLH
jgi:hypothetical protein